MFMMVTQTSGEKTLITVRSIVHMEAQRDKVQIKMSDGKTINVKETLEGLILKLHRLPGVRIAM